MKKLMALVVLLVVALIAAPAIAQNESTNPEPAPGDAAGDDPGAALPKASQEPPLPEAPAPETPAPDVPAPEGPAPDAPVPEGPVPEGPVPEGPAPEVPSNDDSLVSDAGDDTITGPGEGATITDTGSDGGDGPNDSNRDDDVVYAGKDAKDKATRDEVVDAEDREDRVADRIVTDLKDRKKDKDKDDEDEDDEDGVEQNTDQDADSGDVDQDADVINTGDNVNQCVGILQVANTGNAQNATGVAQFDSETDEIELEDGSQITLTPQLIVDCRQIILQIVKGERPNESKIPTAKLREVVQATRGVAPSFRTSGIPNRVSGIPGRASAGAAVPTKRLGAAATPKVLSTSRAGQPKSSARSLPRTGGSYAPLLGLGAGVLLVGGGLLVRRLAR